MDPILKNEMDYEFQDLESLLKSPAPITPVTAALTDKVNTLHVNESPVKTVEINKADEKLAAIFKRQTFE